MAVRKIDKSKKSNRRCDNCVHWKKRTEAGIYDICHTAGGKRVHYWNCCGHFAWNPDKPYTDQENKEIVT